MNIITRKQGTRLVLMEMHHPKSNGKTCLAWYTRPHEEAALGAEFALQCTIKRLVEYNRQRQLFGRTILVYATPKQDGDKPIACYNAAGERIW
jgi:hypothetical protein